MSERAFGIDHPFFLEQSVDKPLVNSGQFLLKGFNILCPEDFAHCLYGEEVFPLAFGCFPFALRVQPATGHDAMQVGMQSQGLPPGMQDADHTCQGTEVFGVLAKSPDRVPRGFKQCVVHHFGRLQGQGVEQIREGEHNMKVGHGQKLRFPVLYPCFPVFALTFGTMTVAATIIDDPDPAASGAGVLMPAQRGSTTAHKSPERAQLPSV